MASESLTIPLLRDRHTHPFLYAAFLEGVDLGRDPAESREQALARIREHAHRGRSGWTIAYGWNSARYPLAKEDFDDLPPLAVLNLSLHGAIVNEAGRTLLQRSDPAVADNLDDQDWTERNLQRVLYVLSSAGATPERLRRFFTRLLEEHGVYYAEEMLLLGENVIPLMAEAGLIERTRFWAAPATYERLSRALQAHVHGIKLFTDGALGTRTAALDQPYRGSRDAGLLIYQPQELARLVAHYAGIGMPLAVHAIGDRAIEQVVSVVEAIQRPAGSEIRLEHAQFISDATARRAKRLGIRLCMQPNFSDDSVHYADRLPEGHPPRNNPFRMLIDRVGYQPGVDLLLGSDGMPHGVQEGLRQALFPPYPEQALTIDEFIAGYCAPDLNAGRIEVRIDHQRRQVAAVVRLNQSPHSPPLK